MFVGLGQDCVARAQEIVGIFDLDTSTVSKITRECLRQAEREGRLRSVGMELPKSLILCKKKEKADWMVVSPVSCATLMKRLGGDSNR